MIDICIIVQLFTNANATWKRLKKAKFFCHLKINKINFKPETDSATLFYSYIYSFSLFC